MVTRPMTGFEARRAEFTGLAAISKARKDNFQMMFQGTRLKFGGKGLLNTVKNLEGGVRAMHKAAKITPGTKKVDFATLPSSVREQITSFFTKCADVDNIDALKDVLGAATVANLLGEAAPVFGVLVSSGKLAAAIAIVAKDGADLYRYASYREGFLSGDPVAAADAIKTIMERNRNKHAVQAAQHAAATGAKIAGLFVDFGSVTTVAIGVANAAATLGLQLAALGLEIKEMKAGNEILKHPGELDINVFKVCPILGCYLLTCSDTSSVANMFVADIGLPGWMDKVETLKKTRMDPLLKIATDIIAASYLQLEGLAPNKGTHQVPGFFAKKKQGLVDYLKKKLG